MRFDKRAVLASATGLLMALGSAAAVQAQEWAPTKVVRIIVPIVGSTNDVLARLAVQVDHPFWLHLIWMILVMGH